MSKPKSSFSSKTSSPLASREIKWVSNLEIGQFVRKLRKTHGVSQQQLASALKISQGNVSKIENGLLTLDAAQWMAFCDLLQLPYDALTRDR